MPNAIKKLSTSAVFQERASVVSLEDRAVFVQSDTGRYRAARAVSCLVEPEIGDLVLVAVGEDGSSHVLAVLERESTGRTVLAVEGDASVVATGRLQLTGRDGVDLVTGGEANVVASEVSIHAKRGSVVADAMTLVGGLLRADVDSAKLVARALDHVLERFTQRTKASYRTIEELDRVRAHTVDHVASGTMKVHARETVVTADGLVKMDADQIHVG
jgi:hypothetical protein